MSEPMQANDAEARLLGAALAGYPELDDLLAAVEPDDFYRPHHAEVWTAIARVHHAGNRPDPVSVRLALSAAEVRHDPTVLVDLAQAVDIPASAPYYAEQVTTAAGLRRLQQAGTRLHQLGGTHGDLDERREQARQAVDEATRGKHRTRARTMAELLPETIDHAQHGAAEVLSTGWPDLDRLIGGLAPGRLVVFGARPGVGKSIAGTNLALHFAGHHNHAVLIASMEMPENEVTQRLLSAYAGVNLTHLQQGLTDEAAWNRVAARSAELLDMPITVDDTPGQTVTSIRKAVRDAQRRRDDLALVVVDYLQLVAAPSDDRNATEAQKLGEVSRGLKLLARESGACVVAMVQVNREGTRHSDGRPRMTDLRGSGAIEADADQVVLMHQPDDDEPEVELIVDKNRHGPKGQARLMVQGHYARLVSTEWNPSRGIA